MFWMNPLGCAGIPGKIYRGEIYVHRDSFCRSKEERFAVRSREALRMIFPPARLVESMTPSPASAGSDCPAQATKNVPVKPSISIAVQDPVAKMVVVGQVAVTVMKILV